MFFRKKKMTTQTPKDNGHNETNEIGKNGTKNTELQVIG